jgi:LPXTG-motif cell wall-anchored protein
MWRHVGGSGISGFWVAILLDAVKLNLRRAIERGLCVSGVEAGARVSVRRLGVVIAVPVASLVTACGSSGTQQSTCESAGKVYSQRVLVDRGNKKEFNWITLFIVCKPDHHLGIVDSDGKTYENLDDFRANNDLLDREDTITLPRDFPSVDRRGKVDLMTVSGHTGTPWVWYLAGGVGFVVAIGAGLWLYRRRQITRDWPEEPAL